ncbi:Protein CBG20618 [Caenorhabditis briggsae]|uniref:Protein CBG20618 n=1 Tax=Caenorhabditis briggsae TaxID=6238 RepID=A8XY79_CAEBR|nr:Protein CBG20618 [Caenorhabditis briggsae]CAP37596.2 Protein CBG20618 [Caenorhabditis briggsae]
MENSELKNSVKSVNCASCIPEKDPEEDLQAATAAAVEEAEKANWGSRAFVKLGQTIGVVELTKLEPRFEVKIKPLVLKSSSLFFQRNIDKLISYHNIIYKMVDAIELQVQVVPKMLAQKKVSCNPGENPWEMLGGWLNFLGINHYTGPHAKIVMKYSKACGKISQKEALVQKRSGFHEKLLKLERTKISARSHLIKRMRVYTSEESEELNETVAGLGHLLHSIDESRHQLKSANTLEKLKEKGEAYRIFVKAFDHKASAVQAAIDEVATQVSLHQHELLKFSREVSVFNDSVFNSLNEVILRLGYHIQK